MAKFRKKPIVVDAIQWDGSEQSWNDITVMGCTPVRDETCEIDEIIIPTLEDGSKSQVKHIATIGDYVIKGIDGEFYPCKADIFAKTFDQVTGDILNDYMENVRIAAIEMAKRIYPNWHNMAGKEILIDERIEDAHIAVRLQAELLTGFLTEIGYSEKVITQELFDRGLISSL